MNTMLTGIGFGLPRPLAIDAAGKVQMQDFHFAARIGSPLDPALTLFRTA